MPGASDHVERCARICAERAWRFACSLMGNAADADDVVQEAFVIAARKAHAIPNDDPWPWFAAVLANVARNARRKRAHAARFGHRPGDDAMSGLSGHDPDPADAMADEEFAKYLRESLATLPDAEREAVTITAIAGLSYRDAAEVLGVPFGTLTSRVHQGLATLRQRLGRPEEAIVRTLGVLPFAPPPGGFEAAATYWANAATLNVSGSTTLGLKLLGGAIMAKYVGAVVVALVLLLAAWLILHDPDDGLAGGTEKNTPLMADGDSDIQPPRDPSRSAFSVPSETPQLSDPASSTADTPAEAETRPVEIPDPVPPAEVKRDKPAEQTPTVPPQPSSGDPYADAPFPVVKNGKILGSRPRWDAGSEVLSVAFSHDRARVVSGNRNGVVHLWDVATGSIIGEFSGHRWQVNSVVFSNDDAFIFSGGRDTRMIQWDIATGKEVQDFKGHKARITVVEPSPDGNLLLSASEDGFIKVWNLEDGKLIHTLAGHMGGRDNNDDPGFGVLGNSGSIDPLEKGVLSASFSPDGKRIASGGSDKKIKIWDAEKGVELKTLDIPGGGLPAFAIDWSPDGDYLVVGTGGGREIMADFGENGMVRYLDVDSGSMIKEWEAHSCSVLDVFMRGDGRHVLSAGQSNDVRLWDVSDPTKPVRTYRGGGGNVNAVDVSPNEQYVAAAGNDGRIRIWNLNTGEPVLPANAEEVGHSIEVSRVAYTPDGRKALTSDKSGRIIEWDVINGVVLREYTVVDKGQPALNDPGLYSLEVSPDGRLFAALDTRGVIHVFDLTNGKKMNTFGGQSPNGIDVPFTGQCEMLFAANGLSIYSTFASYNPDTKEHSSGIQRWDIASGRVVGTLGGDLQMSFCTLDVTPDGKRLVCSGHRNQPAAQGNLFVFDLTTGSVLKAHIVKETLEGYPGQQPYEIVMSIRKLAISPDGTSAAVGSNGMAFVDLESGEVLHRFGGQARMQQDIEFSPDGRYVLTGSWAGNVVLWDVKTGEVATLFRGHEGPVLSVAFTADGKQVLSGSADKTARIWDLSDAIK